MLDKIIKKDKDFPKRQEPQILKNKQGKAKITLKI